MLKQEDIDAIQTRLNELDNNISEGQTELIAQVAIDTRRLMTEVFRLQLRVTHLVTHTHQKIDQISADFERIDAECNRLRNEKNSAEFERDATVALLCQIAKKAGINVGRAQNHAVVDLPAGQVHWEFLPEDSHMIESLPEYSDSLQAQTMQENYTKVMNSGIN